jgi:hypothetical protein
MRGDSYGGYNVEEGEFGPGTALVLSLFAVLLLVAALAWSQDNLGQHAPVAMSFLSEDKSYFAAGDVNLGPAAREQLTDVVRRSRNQTRFNHLQVIGYASPEGNNNGDLAARRAKKVRDYLVYSLRVPDECVIVANFSDSHSSSLRDWMNQGLSNSLERFRGTSLREQKELIGESKLQRERMVAILGVYHRDSICRLDKIP